MTSQTPKLDELYLQLSRLIDAELQLHPPVNNFLRKHLPNHQPSALVITISAVIITLLVFGVFGYNVVVLVGSIYPIYRTMIATVENDPDDRKRWLTFWLVFGCTTYMDPVIRFVLGFVPFYYLLKLAMYIALAHPRTDLAMALYIKFIKPMITKIEPPRVT